MSVITGKPMITLPFLLVVLLELTSGATENIGHVEVKDTETHIPTRMSTKGRSKVTHASPSVISSSRSPTTTKNNGNDGPNYDEIGESVAAKPPGTPAGIVPYKGMSLRNADCPGSHMEVPVKQFDIFADMWQLIALAAMVCLAVSLIVTFVLCLLLFRMRVTKELEKDLLDRQPMKPDIGEASSYVSFASPDEHLHEDHPIKITVQDTDESGQEQKEEPRREMTTFKIRKMTPV